jgi:hypothetical protein
LTRTTSSASTRRWSGTGLGSGLAALAFGFARLAAAEPSRAEDPLYEPEQPEEPEEPPEPKVPSSWPRSSRFGGGYSPAEPEQPAYVAPTDGSPRAEDPNYEPAASGRPVRVSDSLPRLEGKALKDRVPDLEITSWPPPWRVTFVAGTHFPLQEFGLGLGGQGYWGEFLRLEVFYSGGVSFKGNRELAYVNYAKALVGLKFLGGWTTIDVDVGPPKKHPLDPAPDPVLKASLPAHHAVLVEAGLLTGMVPLRYCTLNCPPGAPNEFEDEPESKYDWDLNQLVFPFAGFRYVYSLGARSKKLPIIDRTFVVQVFAHAIYRPFFDSRRELYWSRSEERVERFFVGGEGGVSVPFCSTGCVGVHITAGFLPAPASAMVGVAFGR